VAASKAANFTLSTSALSASDGTAMSLSGINVANLTSTKPAGTFTVSGWTGNGSLSNASIGAETVVATKSANITLSNTALTSSDGMNLALNGISLANLTVTSLSAASYTLNASAFTGTAVLTATGAVSAALLGGSGNDTLSTTSSGNSILVGNGGNDTLSDTGSGYNILIGGAGLDTITGDGNDIIISGYTNYDNNLAALDAILAEWSSSDPYSTRITKIMNGVPGGYALNSGTVHADAFANVLNDGSNSSQNNWFFASKLDKVKSMPNETVTLIN
jgi:hypothetical protein